METTIPSYLTAQPSRDLIVAGHQQLTHEWWEKRRDDFEIFISQFVIDEASLGDPEMVEKRLKVINDLAQLEITDDVTSLAGSILSEGAIPEKAAIDAAHIAMATVHGMNYLMTWNCTHIANAEISAKVGDICDSEGYEYPIVCTPEELMGSD